MRAKINFGKGRSFALAAELLSVSSIPEPLSEVFVSYVEPREVQFFDLTDYEVISQHEGFVFLLHGAFGISFSFPISDVTILD